jgi:hypothetical protein
MAVATGSLKPFELDTQEKVKEAQQTLAGGDRVQFLGELANSFGDVAGVLSRSAKRDMGYAEEDMDPHQRALKMVAESDGGLDYVEALKKTMFS